MLSFKSSKRKREEDSNNSLTPQKSTPLKKDDKPLTEEEKLEYSSFIAIKESLESEITSFNKNSEAQSSMKEIMELLHDYNNIKDATQVILGALATMRGVTVASLHEEFDLPLKDE